MSLVTLPEELFSMVVSLGILGNYPSPKGIRDLVSLSRTCTHLYRRVTPILWRHVVFDPSSERIRANLKHCVLRDQDQQFENEDPVFGQSYYCDEEESESERENCNDSKDDDDEEEEGGHDNEARKCEQVMVMTETASAGSGGPADLASDIGPYLGSKPHSSCPHSTTDAMMGPNQVAVSADAAATTTTALEIPPAQNSSILKKASSFSMFQRALDQNLFSAFVFSAIREITFALPTCGTTLAQVLSSPGRPCLTSVARINIQDCPTRFMADSEKVVLQGLARFLEFEQGQGLGLEQTSCSTSSWVDYRHSAPNLPCKLKIYNTSLPRLREFHAAGLVKYVTDLNIALVPPHANEFNNSDGLYNDAADKISECEYRLFSKVVRAMRDKLERLTITDLCEYTMMRQAKPPQPSPTGNAHNLAQALKGLKMLKYLALPNSLRYVFRAEWLPPALESLECFTVFEKLWQGSDSSKTMAVQALPTANEVNVANGSKVGTAHCIKVLHLSLPKPSTEHSPLSPDTSAHTMPSPSSPTHLTAIPFTGLTTLDLWSHAPCPAFVSNLVHASASSLTYVRLSFATPQLIHGLAQTVARTLETLVVDDWDYIKTAAATSGAVDETRQVAALVEPEPEPETETETETEPESDVETETEEPTTPPTCPSLIPMPAQVSTTPFTAAAIDLLSSCHHLKTLVLTALPHDLYRPALEPVSFGCKFYVKYRAVEKAIRTKIEFADPDTDHANNGNTPSAQQHQQSLKFVPIERPSVNHSIFNTYYYYEQDPHLNSVMGSTIFRVVNEPVSKI